MERFLLTKVTIMVALNANFTMLKEEIRNFVGRRMKHLHPKREIDVVERLALDTGGNSRCSRTQLL